MAGSALKLILELPMPSHSLLNEHQISFPASLAQAIGVDNAILLAVLNDAARLQQQNWARLNSKTLRQQLPFWNDGHIRNVMQSLLDQGMLRLNGPLFPDAEGIIYSFPAAQTSAQAPAQNLATAQPSANQRIPKQPMTDDWTPDTNALKQLRNLGIDESYALSQLGNFRLYGKENGVNQRDWGHRFVQYVQKQHQHDRTSQERQKTALQYIKEDKQASPITSDWRPDPDSYTILTRGGIEPAFIEETIPEFILYWRENGRAMNSWSTVFNQHVSKQWMRYQNGMQHPKQLLPMHENWRPSDFCFEVLEMAYIGREEASRMVPEFILYWLENNQVSNNWDTIFIRYAKKQHAYRLSQGDSHGANQANQPGYRTAAGIRQQLDDTSW